MLFRFYLLGEINSRLENFKSDIKLDFQKQEYKIDNKIKALESDKKLLQQQKNSTGITK